MGRNDYCQSGNCLNSREIGIISKALGCAEEDVMDIYPLKKGMTNDSFHFSVNGCRYIIRIPGAGTDRLINRKNEYAVYNAISGLGLCDAPVYINPDNGYKIARYLDGVRSCDSNNIVQLDRCMSRLRELHESRLYVQHSFDIFAQIDFYESLREGTPSVYEDYEETKKNVYSLKGIVDRADKEWCLTHIDAVCDNFLFYYDECGRECLQLTDWEYAGMQDPHVDIAMFCVYSMYDKPECDRLIDIYFEGICDDSVRTKIYCYIAMCGLLWSNWCEYKMRYGENFGEYSVKQYNYAIEYYHYVIDRVSGDERNV